MATENKERGDIILPLDNPLATTYMVLLANLCYLRKNLDDEMAISHPGVTKEQMQMMVDRSITGRLKVLTGLGYGMEATEIINFSKARGEMIK